MIKKGYKLPHEFPNESFVQECLEEHFIKSGFTIIRERPIDLKCINKTTNEIWIIEVKGKTTQIGLDFKTCLGQLLMRMSDPTYKYAIAMPDIISYHQQINKIPKSVQEKLNLHWFFIDQNGCINHTTS
ncbi:hypothetical protein AAH223_003485 [Enterobacter hormaechei]